ncbi:DNA methyltransferase [Helicobacter pylori]
MLKEYLEGIKDLTPEKNELTHRPSLHNLLIRLKDNFNKEFKIEHEPERKQGSQPDFRISYQGLNIGYIENKRAGTNLSQLLKSDQILKYLELNPNLMLTDYLNFMWVGKDENNAPLIKKEISVASLDELSKPLKPKPQTERDLIELFKSFFNHEAAPITNAKDFATHLSPRTRYLKEALIKYQEKTQVSSIFNNFKEYLYEELSFEDFSDALAQTLTYSLFLAKLNHPFEKINLDNVRSSIPKNFAVIREMADFLKKLDEIKEIQWLLNEILSSINHVDMDSILKDLNDDKDPYLHFYETFLSAYDPKLREKKGVYYTPDSVVKFIINALDSLLKTRFKDAPLGLKSALDNENIKLLDFATGTGTFLLEAFRKALEVRKTSDGGTSTKEDKYQNLLKQFYGFEYLIAPYAIAHLNLSQAFKEEFKKPLKENDALKIILTNTLIQPSEIAAYRGLNPIFETELLNAQEIKKDENILIITGNPPYSGASSNEGLFEWEVKATYGIEPEFQTIEIEKKVKLTAKIQTLLKNIQTQKQGDKSVKNTDKDALKNLKQIHSKYKLQDEKNPKWILDDYVKFMRFAQNKIESLGHGLFGFISNNAFLDNPTFRGLRRSLLECYDELYILNLHGNARKKEKTPQGAKDENVFNIKQGVSINLFVKKAQTTKQKIHYYDVYGERAEKYAFLAQNDLNSIEWLELTPKKPFYLLLPLETRLLDEYEQGFSVQKMFQVGGTGICSKRDHVVFYKKKESLLKLLKDFSTLEPIELRRKYNIGDDSRDWRLEYAIRDVRANADNLEKYIILCQYRPFDYRWTYYTPNSRTFLAYPVYDVFKHMLPPPTNPKTPNQTRKNVALNTPRQLKNNDKSWTQCFISSRINDQGLSSGGNGAGVNYPLYQFRDPNYTENFTPEFRGFIDKHYNHSFEPLEILGYIYALLYSPNYRKRYEGFLKIDYPKILFTENKDLFRALSLLGIELIGLHVLNQESLNYSFEKLKDATIGESVYKEERNPIIKKPSHNEQRLYINHSAYFVGVSQEIYDYRIGGYCVLDKYLKSHKDESCDFDHVSNIIKVIARTIEIQKTLGFLTSDLPHLKGNDSQALMQEILQNPPPPPPFNTNIALILSRQAKAIGDLDFDGAFISKEASDNNIYRRGGGTAFPLFCIA